MNKRVLLPTIESIVAKKKPTPEVVVVPAAEPVRDSEGLIQVAFEYIAECIEKADPDLMLDGGGLMFGTSPTDHVPLHSLQSHERQQLLKRVAEMPGYQVELLFGSDGDYHYVPSYVFDWPELWYITYDHIDTFGIQLVENEEK